MYYLMNNLERKGCKVCSRLIYKLNIIINGIDINPKTTIGCGLKIHHGVGLVIGAAVTIGENFTVFQNVTIGTGSLKLIKDGVKRRSPVIGDNVIIYPHSVIVGPIEIGDNVVIGAKCLVTKNVPAGELIRAGTIWK